MARPIWSGSISFGLVNIPVKLYSAVSQKEVHFHQLHKKDGGRISYKRVCTKDDTEVPFEDIAKGYEISRDEYVMIDPEELKSLDPESTRNIEIREFVSLNEIDPIYWEHTYYLAPDRGAAKAYGLLFHAMQKSNRVAIARMVLRTKQYLCTLRPMGQALALSTMQYPDELVPQDALEGLPTKAEAPSQRELAMAEQLIETLAAPFEPDKYHDEHRERVLELISRKAEGEPIIVQPSQPRPAKVVNLMDALKASLQTSGASANTNKPTGKPRRAPQRTPKRARPRKAR